MSQHVSAQERQSRKTPIMAPPNPPGTMWSMFLRLVARAIGFALAEAALIAICLQLSGELDHYSWPKWLVLYAPIATLFWSLLDIPFHVSKVRSVSDKPSPGDMGRRPTRHVKLDAAFDPADVAVLLERQRGVRKVKRGSGARIDIRGRGLNGPTASVSAGLESGSLVVTGRTSWVVQADHGRTLEFVVAIADQFKSHYADNESG